MDRQAAAVEVVRLVAQQVEKLGVHERRHKIEGAVRVGDNDEQADFRSPRVSSSSSSSAMRSRSS